MQNRVTVVIVSYNTRELLLRCIGSLGGVHEVIVVDNASSDGSARAVRERYPHAKVIENRNNIGFGRACNQGMMEATGGLILLLNSDARATPGAIEKLAACFNDRTVIAAGGRLEHPDGSLQESACGKLTLWSLFCEQSLLEKAFPRSRFFSPYWQSSRSQSGTSRVEQVMGACLMMRPGTMFNSEFFLYCEDTELCARLRRQGEILYVPSAVFHHELGASSSSSRWVSVARYNRGKEIYFRIHHGQLVSFIAWWINRSGALLRLLIWLLATLFTVGTVKILRERTVLFTKVLFAPWHGPPEG